MSKRQKALVNKSVFRIVPAPKKQWLSPSSRFAVLVLALAVVWSFVIASDEEITPKKDTRVIPTMSSPFEFKTESEPTPEKKTLPGSIDKPKYADAQSIEFRGQMFHVVRFPAHQSGVRLYWKDKDGEKFKNFETLRTFLEKEKKEQLVFAMNGGIYSELNDPIGLYKEDAATLIPLNKDTSGFGNFYMQPNGVFAFSNDRAIVVTTAAFNKMQQQFTYATQSGPMLVIDHSINKQFKVNSPNKFIRNGVGIDKHNNMCFVISDEPVNFFELASFFKDKLGCDNALYLDGAISKLYSVDLKFTDLTGNFGPIIGFSVSSSE
jgi:uncharacterized protein YigE (DUF2233 family)